MKCDKFVADDNKPTQTQTRSPLEDVYQREQGKVRQKGGRPTEEYRMEGGVPEAGERVGGVMKAKWKKFWFESNMFSGWIESMDDWNELRNAYPEMDDDDLLASKEFYNSRMHNYGMRWEHTGPKTLADFFRENGMRLTPRNRFEPVITFIRRRIWFGWQWFGICSSHGHYRHSCRRCRAGHWRRGGKWFGKSGPIGGG